jgi:hypothetical protein
MWIILAGLTFFTLGIFLLLVILSPKGDERPLLFTCQRCGVAFGTPPLHPLPERYQEEDVSLCGNCGADLEERIREVVREAKAEFLGGGGVPPPVG